MIGGDYNRVTAVIKHNNTLIHNLHGKWDECLYLTDAKKNNVYSYPIISSLGTTLLGCPHHARSSQEGFGRALPRPL